MEPNAGHNTQPIIEPIRQLVETCSSLSTPLCSCRAALTAPTPRTTQTIEEEDEEDEQEEDGDGETSLLDEMLDESGEASITTAKKPAPAAEGGRASSALSDGGESAPGDAPAARKASKYNTVKLPSTVRAGSWAEEKNGEKSCGGCCCVLQNA